MQEDDLLKDIIDPADEEYRNRIATVDEEGKRVWLYPKKPSGKWYNRRRVLGYSLLAVLALMPWIEINGEPFMMFNILERKFIITGVIFHPHDFHLFALLMIAGVIGIALFTVVYGRLFCGWICPQTIFMELVFRPIEFLIEGDRNRRRALDKKKWGAEKARKKILKHAIFYLLSFLTANVFLSYIIGVDELMAIVTDSPMNHLGGLIGIMVFSVVFYFVFSSLREQVCTVICPYGRLQGALLDRDSVVIAYDHERGENRAKFRKNEDRTAEGKGDCIDCFQCVDVCPTGIDIRDGIQLECTNCTACIDACNTIMDRIGKPKGLIRYSSTRAIEEGKELKFKTKAIAYSAVLLVLLGVISFLMLTRDVVEVHVHRVPGTVYNQLDDDRLMNLFEATMVNKSTEEITLNLQLLTDWGELQVVGEIPVIEPTSEEKVTFMIIQDRSEIEQFKTPLEVGAFQGDQLIEKEKVMFIGPN